MKRPDVGFTQWNNKKVYLNFKFYIVKLTGNFVICLYRERVDTMKSNLN